MWNVFITQAHHGNSKREWNFSGTAGECQRFLHSHRFTEGKDGNGFFYSIFKSSPFQSIYSSK